MNQYKIYFKNKESIIIKADDFEVKLPAPEGQRRLVLTLGKSNVAVFNWSMIVGIIKLDT